MRDGLLQSAGRCGAAVLVFLAGGLSIPNEASAQEIGAPCTNGAGAGVYKHVVTYDVLGEPNGSATLCMTSPREDTTPATTAKPPPTTAKAKSRPAPTPSEPKKNTIPITVPAKPKKTESSVAPPTTENPDTNGNGIDDRIDFVKSTIDSQAAAAEATQGYPVFNTGSVTQADVLNILAGNTTVGEVLAKYQIPPPTTVPTEAVAVAVAVTVPTTETPLLVVTEDGNDVLIASPPVEQTTEKLTPKEEKSNTDGNTKLLFIGSGVLMLAGIAYRIRSGNSKEILYKGPGIQ